MTKTHIKKIFLNTVFIKIILFSLFFSACGMSKEEKINDTFLKDSLQHRQTELLKKSNQDNIEIDTAMNNFNSKDPAIPVFDDEN